MVRRFNRRNYNEARQSWKLKLRIPSLKSSAIQWDIDTNSIDRRKNAGRGRSEILVYIAGPLEESPTASQLRALNYLDEHGDEVVNSALGFALKQAISCYYSDSLPSARACPVGQIQLRKSFQRLEGFRQLVSPLEVSILREEKNRCAFVSMDFASAFDEEHGFSVLIHRKRALSWAGAGEYGGGPPVSSRRSHTRKILRNTTSATTSDENPIKAIVRSSRKLKRTFNEMKSLADVERLVPVIETAALEELRLWEIISHLSESQVFAFAGALEDLDKFHRLAQSCEKALIRILSDIPGSSKMLRKQLKKHPKWEMLLKLYG